MVRQFIEGWDMLQILGEGTFAEVKLLHNRVTGESCAMKEINLVKHPDQLDQVKKEICVHKLLRHPHIVQCYGSRLEKQRQYIFLEYCPAGELFDRIEPDIGMAEHKAHNFFRQMMSAVSYLHERGVAHRDIKPENLLLADENVLKLSDFGMATVFRHKGTSRELERRCGTMPYVAPEVLMRPHYMAEPADLWSCGVVLTAMLTGELPWDRPTPDQANFASWRDGDYASQKIWSKVDNLPLSLLRKLLQPMPSRRYTAENIQNHLWFKKKFRDSAGQLLEPDLVSPRQRRRRASKNDVADEKRDYEPPLSPPDVDAAAAACVVGAPNPAYGDVGAGVATTPAGAFQSHFFAASGAASQEEPILPSTSTADAPTHSKAGEGNDRPAFCSFSQPAKVSNLFTGTQQSTQSQGSQSIYQRLVKRMTRFWAETSYEKTDAHLKSVLQKLGYQVTSKTKGIYTIGTHDRRGALLLFKCTFISVDKRVLLDFRLSRGCGLEFKKHFAKIKANCHDIVDKAPILWPTLLAADAMPSGK